MSKPKEYTVLVTATYWISVTAQNDEEAIEKALDCWAVSEYEDHEIVDTKIHESYPSISNED